VPEPTTVFLVDDDDLVRTGLRIMLGTQPDMTVIGEAADAASGLDLIERTPPDVVLMDIRMAGMDGITATEQLTAAGSADDHSPRVVILTTFGTEEYLYAALRAGASGFLLKRSRPEEIAAAIRVVAAGDALIAPALTRQLIGRYAHRPSPEAATRALADLTDRERDVLVEIARGLSNAEIAVRLYVSQETVKTHVKRIFTKLGLRDRAQAVVIAYESGLVQPGD
jgi:DNA-binding NarL/FixJ family response regulator